MRKLRFDLYSGFVSDPKYTEKDCWKQAEGETIEELAEAIKQAVIDNAENLLDEEGDNEDE